MPADAPSPAHRRAWRLAFLMTGSADAASSLIGRVQKIQRAPESLEPALLDRLIIQNARSLPRSTIVNLPASATTPFGVAAPASAALSAALKLPHQPLEAWILKRIDDLDDLHIARAMDCSKTAARVHLSAADESIAGRLGDRLAPAIAALRAYADSLDPAPFILAHREQTRLARLTRLKTIALVAAAAALIAAFVILKLTVSGGF